MTGRTLFDRIWDAHVVADLGDGWSLLHVDRHLLHDLSGPPALARLSDRGQRVRSPELAFATPDHVVSTAVTRLHDDGSGGRVAELRRRTSESGIRMFDLGETGQGIVHVMAPELGLTLPGLTMVCGDSHTCTNGALGALAFGIGSSEITHVLATQTIRQRRPKQMRIWVDGSLVPSVSAKDLILHVIARLGASAGQGHAVEFAGPGIAALEIEERMTLCNLTVEMGSKMALIAPDDRTLAYIKGRTYAPRRLDWDKAVAYWRELRSDEEAIFDLEHRIDAADVRPMITWGTSPDQAVAIGETVPAQGAVAALEYMGLKPGDALEGLPVDWVFIGSCANSRLSDLRAAAKVLKGRRVAEGVRAWAVPGSESVRQAAVAEGLDQVFREAGFDWREAGCSLCVAANGEQVPPGKRAVSTSNRNFVGRQGPGARTHLVSPAMAAAAAVAGCIADVRDF